eukprot:11251644-Alexandrium_andersonii.AAC.1
MCIRDRSCRCDCHRNGDQDDLQLTGGPPSGSERPWTMHAPHCDVRPASTAGRALHAAAAGEG